MNKLLYRKQYDELTDDVRESLLKNISKENPQFVFSRFECFEKNGIQTKTAVYLYNDSEFVFVSGYEELTLGWDNSMLDIDNRIELDILKEVDDNQIEDFDFRGYLKNYPLLFVK